MKPSSPDLEQKLDELAEGLDAGWDMPESAPVSLTPLSAPLPDELDELDADWDVAAPTKAPAAAPVPIAARSAQPRPSAARPSQARPSPTRAVTPPVVAGAVPVRVSKKDRREAERKRRVHEAQQKSTQKKERKAERRAEALRSSEQNRQTEERAAAERRARDEQNASPKRTKAKSSKTEGERNAIKRVPKRVRHEHTRARSAPAEAVEKSKPAPVIAPERGAKKLILPLLIALLVAVTLGFALSRAH